MRSSAALLLGVLLVVSAVCGVGAGHPDDAVRALGTLSPSTSSDAPTTLPLATSALSNVPGAAETSSTPPDTASNTTNAPSNSTNSSVNVTAHDGTELRISIRENGNARWSVTTRFVLHGENETAAFRKLATDYENGNTNVGFTRTTFERVVEHAATDTDRPMSLRNVSQIGDVRQNGSVGVLSISFTWTNFTRVEGSQIVLGDVFWVDSETWLPTLSEEQALVIAAPESYIITDASPSGGTITNGTALRYEGPQRFSDGDFSMTYSPRNREPSTTTPDGFLDLSATSGFVVVLFLFGMGFGAYAISQRRGPAPEPVEETDSVDGSPPAPTVAEDLDGEGRDADAGDEDEDDEPPMELLSDEERVLRLLRENDGRMKQANIVTETNWSNAKVSQLLSKMNENDDVNKLRIGRENLITLPDEDVTDVD